MGDSEFEYSDEEYGNVVNSSLQQAQVRGRVPSAPVSYTHLTLPTILRV